MTLILTRGSLSLTLGNPFLSPFTEGNFPRTRIDVPAFTRSFAGAVVADAVPYESPHTWGVGCKLRHSDAATLRRIYSLWLNTRPFGYITLDDNTERIYEAGALAGDRTRALAAGASVAIDASGLSYFARFNVLFVDPPEFAQDGAWVRCQFQLLEGAKTTP
jgi:hypothetical protein